MSSVVELHSYKYDDLRMIYDYLSTFDDSYKVIIGSKEPFQYAYILGNEIRLIPHRHYWRKKDFYTGITTLALALITDLFLCIVCFCNFVFMKHNYQLFFSSFKIQL